MRIGTWNLANRWSDLHRELLLKQKCDVWLLTEVNPLAVNPIGRIAGFHCHLSAEVMLCKQHWAAVLSGQPLVPLPNPHPASAAALIDGITYCSSILPWATCGNEPPWVGSSLAEKVVNTLSNLLAALPHQDLVWGGDWNQNLTGEWENVGTKDRQSILDAISSFNLRVATADLLHQNSISHSIDHIAIPFVWKFEKPIRVAATGLSDHDAYVIQVYDPHRWISENAFFRWVNEGCIAGRALRHWLDAEDEFHAIISDSR